ncbi:MAG: glutathione S-transferase N-terminal domain-containing protein [Steroidobacteraceae bacterium]|jgi:glutathione S-transferase
MKLFYAVTSPFVRKCLVSAYELKLRERLELVPAAAHPINRDPAVVAVNPLGKVPALITDEGAVLIDSRVICEYLNTLGDGHLIPASGAARFRVLADQALADGLLDAAVLTRYETAVRPESLRWDAWIRGQLDKVTCALAELERRAGELAGRIDVGTIAIGCALGYLDFRYASMSWRDQHPAAAAWYAEFAQRESMAATRPA